MNINEENSINQFKLYVSQFDLSNEMISRKIDHTFRVCEYAKEIAKNENLNHHDSHIAFICALLHDIARFKQVTEFNTFNDLKSFDHGDMGYEILKTNNYIDNYINNEDDKKIVLNAVKNHNKYSIDNSLNKTELFFAKLVRDADKIDILDKQRNEILDNNPTIESNAIEIIKKHKLFRRDGFYRNDGTEIVYRLSFIFDLNFKRSFEIINEKKIIEHKLDVLRENCDKIVVDEIEYELYNYIKNTALLLH